MTNILLLFCAFVIGVLAGYVAHIVLTNYRLIKKGISPKEFFKDK